MDRPDVSGRVEILKVHSKGKTLGKDVDLEKIARRTPGFTGECHAGRALLARDVVAAPGQVGCFYGPGGNGLGTCSSRVFALGCRDCLISCFLAS